MQPLVEVVKGDKLLAAEGGEDTRERHTAADIQQILQTKTQPRSCDSHVGVM